MNGNALYELYNLIPMSCIVNIWVFSFLERIEEFIQFRVKVRGDEWLRWWISITFALFFDDKGLYEFFISRKNWDYWERIRRDDDWIHHASSNNGLSVCHRVYESRLVPQKWISRNNSHWKSSHVKSFKKFNLEYNNNIKKQWFIVEKC